MKQTVVITAMMIAVAFSAFAQRQDETELKGKIVHRLKQFESDWLAASLNQDKTWLERFFAGKLLVVPFENDAAGNRARDTVEMIDPKLKSDEMKIRISGNVTLLTNGGNRSFYFLDTFNRRGGKWQVIATHFSETPQPAAENVEQTVMQMQREWNALAIKKDIAGLRRIVADDFLGVESSGRVADKDQFIKNIETVVAPVRFKTDEDVKVRVFGDTAIVTGRLSVNSATDYSPNLLFTNVWAKRDGRWQIVSQQATRER